MKYYLVVSPNTHEADKIIVSAINKQPYGLVFVSAKISYLNTNSFVLRVQSDVIMSGIGKELYLNGINFVTEEIKVS